MHMQKAKNPPGQVDVTVRNVQLSMENAFARKNRLTATVATKLTASAQDLTTVLNADNTPSRERTTQTLYLNSYLKGDAMNNCAIPICRKHIRLEVIRSNQQLYSNVPPRKINVSHLPSCALVRRFELR